MVFHRLLSQNVSTLSARGSLCEKGVKILPNPCGLAQFFRLSDRAFSRFNVTDRSRGDKNSCGVEREGVLFLHFTVLGSQALLYWVYLETNGEDKFSTLLIMLLSLLTGWVNFQSMLRKFGLRR